MRRRAFVPHHAMMSIAYKYQLWSWSQVRALFAISPTATITEYNDPVRDGSVIVMAEPDDAPMAFDQIPEELWDDAVG